MASFEGASTKVVNQATPDLIGRTLVPFFVSESPTSKVNEGLQVLGNDDDFR